MFPEVSDEIFIMMKQEYEDTSCVNVYPFVRVTDGGMPYVDVYIWDSMLYPKCYIRYVFLDGKLLPDNVEKPLTEYIHRGILKIDGKRMLIFSQSVKRNFPQWNYEYYSSLDIAKALDHLYYASHPSGPKEILYKAGLGNIAFRLNEIPGCNPIGNTPSKIVGHDLPLKLLRILNRREMIYRLFDEKLIIQSKAVYQEYSGYIDDILPNSVQWNYFERLHANGGLFGGHKFSRRLYEKMTFALGVGDYILDKYERFFVLRNEFNNIRRLRIPEYFEVMQVVDSMEKLAQIKNDAEIDGLISKRSSYGWYEYHGKEYSVVMPRSTMDFFKEATKMKNCVMDYINEHACGDTTILFVRKNLNPDRPFVTIEVRDWCICQAYAHFNELPNAKVYEFLSEYARKNWLYCNTTELATKNDDIVDDYFGEDYSEKEFEELDDFVQLTLQDYYPSLFAQA